MGPAEELVLITPPSETTEALEALPESMPSPLRPDHMQAKVLLVEDGLDNQRLISYLLKRVGAQVTLAENGRDGMTKALQEAEQGTPFDVIFMDMQMPVLDGYAATKALRSEGYQAPIVALTAHVMSGDREKCLAAGCDDYLAKPINREQLLKVLKEMVKQNQQPVASTDSSSD